MSSPIQEASPTMRVSYRKSPARSIVVNLIRSWERSEFPEEAPAPRSPYTFDYIWKLVHDDKTIAQVWMVRGQYSRIGADRHLSPPFLLVVKTSGKVFDLAGLEVIAAAMEPQEVTIPQ
jgi:hypothetical protein